MSTNHDAAAFLSFLDYLGQKGLIPTATAASRKATANKVLAILSEDEAKNVLALDIDPLMQRFYNLNAQQYTPESLQTYKSRMRTALDDFRSYTDNPLAFKPSGQGKTKPKGVADKISPPGKGGLAEVFVNAPSSAPSLPPISVLPIPLRMGLIVQIAGLPFDLTKGEAQKIANIVLAHAAD